jgi:hypothetical protein
MQLTSAIRKDFTPTGVLRASINFGSPILAGRDTSGVPVGVSVDIARQLATRLDAPLELVEFEAAGMSVSAVTREQADLGATPGCACCRAGSWSSNRPWECPAFATPKPPPTWRTSSRT